jgi:hypothetical protein
MGMREPSTGSRRNKDPGEAPEPDAFLWEFKRLFSAQNYFAMPDLPFLAV